IYQVIDFDQESQQWQWDVAKIKSMKATANVLELLEQQMNKTSKETQQLLKVAALLGNVFSLQTLSNVTNKKPLDAARLLREPIEKQMILPLGEKYEFFSEYDAHLTSVFGYEDIDLHFSFVHDRVQQVAHGLMSAEEEKKTRYRIGRRLLAATPQDKIEESIFTIVYYINDAWDLVKDREERLYYSKLNLLAAKKAKNASSYQSAMEFAQMGLAYLDAEQKKENYDLWKDLSAELAECYYHTGNLLQAKRQFEHTLEKVKTVEEKIKILILWNRLYQMKREYHQAIELGYRALNLLQYSLPKQISSFLLWKELMHVRWFLFRNPPNMIRTLPQMTNQRMLLIAELLYSILPPAFVVDQPKFFFIGMRLVLIVKYGISPFSLMGFTTVGMTIPWVTKSHKPSLNLGELSLELSHKYGYQTTEHFALFVYGTFLADQQYPLRECIAMSEEAYEKAIDFGDFMWAGYALYQCCWGKLYAGEPLDLLLKDVQRSYVFNERSENDLTTATSKVLLLYCRAMVEKSLFPLTISDEEFSTESEWNSYRMKGDDFTALMICLCEANFCFFQGEYEKAKTWIERSKEALPSRINFQVWVQTHYLECLVIAALFPHLSSKEQKTGKKTFQKNLRILKEWTLDRTKNKCHFYPLARAEYDRLFYPKKDPIDHYLQAIKLAKDNQFIQDEAIANELAAQYQREKGRDKIADIFLKKAIAAYRKWGANAKVHRLESLHPYLFPSIEMDSISTTQVQKGEIDLMSVIKASRVMSGELVVDQLLTRLMEIVVTTAGATKAFLLLSKGGKLSVVTEWDEVKQQTVVLPSLALKKKKGALCQKIISYVEKVKEPLVLRSASEEGLYTQDPYIADNNIQSVLCIPLIHKNVLFGILYLENNLTTDSFTEERVEILQLLSSEIAIAIDNATLYTNLAKTLQELEGYKNTLERKVDERTIELRKKKEELELTLQKLHTTQKQVVQQEKLAALGFFTQGVAQEIQNPLNIVNKFSETMVKEFNDLSQKLLKAKKTLNFQELKNEIENIYTMSKRINENSLRIKKTVDMMLEHGKAIEGEYSLVNVNELLHQSSEIAYRDFLAKDSSFHVRVIENFDQNIAEIEGIPQSLFRVFFNILHNAFYAAFEKETADVDREPTVSITTKQGDESVEIIIRDNGPGIPEEIRQDIFRQFFTTKPPGTGAGLGLSLSYDIITHEHQGELSINSSTEKGKTFTEVSIKFLHHLPLLVEKREQ
ncbi:MAG: ATP-binding protein, partial [Waddliaceae bacterium]